MTHARFSKKCLAISASMIALASSLLVASSGKADAATYVQLQSLQNGYCIDGTISSITLQPCNPSDQHQFWQEEDDYYFVTTGQDGYQLQNEYNHYCIYVNEADTTITPNSACQGSSKTEFDFIMIYDSQVAATRFQGFDGYDIDGTLSKVYPSLCSGSDAHCLFVTNG